MMVKRIVIDIDEDPALTEAMWKEFSDSLRFFLTTYFDIQEYAMKVENS